MAPLKFYSRILLAIFFVFQWILCQNYSKNGEKSTICMKKYRFCFGGNIGNIYAWPPVNQKMANFKEVLINSKNTGCIVFACAFHSKKDLLFFWGTFDGLDEDFGKARLYYFLGKLHFIEYVFKKVKKLLFLFFMGY